jgi:hypothetical protein
MNVSELWRTSGRGLQNLHRGFESRTRLQFLLFDSASPLTASNNCGQPDGQQVILSPSFSLQEVAQNG